MGASSAPRPGIALVSSRLRQAASVRLVGVKPRGSSRENPCAHCGYDRRLCDPFQAGAPIVAFSHRCWPILPRRPLIDPFGRFDHCAIMRDAHKRFRDGRRLGLDWSFGQCLRTTWASARMRRLCEITGVAIRQIANIRSWPIYFAGSRLPRSSERGKIIRRNIWALSRYTLILPSGLLGSGLNTLLA